MHRAYLFTILETGNNGHGSRLYVCGLRVGCEEVAGGTKVMDGLLFDGFGIGINCLEKDRSCEGIVVGGD